MIILVTQDGRMDVQFDGELFVSSGEHDVILYATSRLIEVFRAKDGSEVSRIRDALRKKFKDHFYNDKDRKGVLDHINIHDDFEKKIGMFYVEPPQSEEIVFDGKGTVEDVLGSGVE